MGPVTTGPISQDGSTDAKRPDVRRDRDRYFVPAAAALTSARVSGLSGFGGCACSHEV
jgi:hypothetical protein